MGGWWSVGLALHGSFYGYSVRLERPQGSLVVYCMTRRVLKARVANVKILQPSIHIDQKSGALTAQTQAKRTLATMTSHRSRSGCTVAFQEAAVSDFLSF